MIQVIEPERMDFVLDLRLFDANKTTDTTETTGNDLSPEMKTFYHDVVIDNAEPELYYSQFGSQYPIPKGRGKSIEFRRFNPLPKALTPLTEGVTPARRKLTVTTVTAEIEQFGDVVEITDILEYTAIDNMLSETAILQGAQAGLTLDTVVREVLMAGSNCMIAPKVSEGVETPVLLRADIDCTCLLTPKVIRDAIASLKRFNTKRRGDGYYGSIIHTDVESDITGDSDWTEWHKYTDPEAMYAGEVGRMHRTRFVATTEAKIIGPEWIFGSAEADGVCRMSLYTALDETGSVNILTNEVISAAQAAELTARIAAAAANGETIKIYVGGNEATLVGVTAGAAGVAKFEVTEAVTDVAEDAMICGYGAGKDGSAVYCTLVVGLNAYGTTEVSGLGLEHIVKPPVDALNQVRTSGWKATKATERLVEAYMIRIEHGSSYGMSAVSN